MPYQAGNSIITHTVKTNSSRRFNKQSSINKRSISHHNKTHSSRTCHHQSYHNIIDHRITSPIHHIIDQTISPSSKRAPSTNQNKTSPIRAQGYHLELPTYTQPSIRTHTPTAATQSQHVIHHALASHQNNFIKIMIRHDVYR